MEPAATAPHSAAGSARPADPSLPRRATVLRRRAQPERRALAGELGVEALSHDPVSLAAAYQAQLQEMAG